MRQCTPQWNRTKQSGYILLYVTILLIALVFASNKFLERTMISMKNSGENRDSAESLLLAESAMNLVYGQFIFDGDIDGNSPVDNRVAIDFNRASPSIELHYIYYVSDGSGINSQIPMILQWVADGEAIAQGEGIDGQMISPSTKKLIIADLFNSDSFPLLYTTNETGNLVKQNRTSWENLINTKKTAVWMELVGNPADDGAAQLYVQAAAQVGNAKSYVQRYVGAYEQTSGVLISPLNQL